MFCLSFISFFLSLYSCSCFFAVPPLLCRLLWHFQTLWQLEATDGPEGPDGRLLLQPHYTSHSGQTAHTHTPETQHQALKHFAKILFTMLLDKISEMKNEFFFVWWTVRVCGRVYVCVQRVGFLPSAGEAVTWRTLQQPVRTFDFHWTVLDVTPSPEEENTHYCKHERHTHTHVVGKNDEDQSLLQYKLWCDVKSCSYFLSLPLSLSLISWFRLRGCPGETVLFPPWSQEASGCLHPWSVFTSVSLCGCCISAYRMEALKRFYLIFLYHNFNFMFICSPRWPPLSVPSRVEWYHSRTG